MKDAARLSLLGAALVMVPTITSAGLLDQLDDATKKLNKASQEIQQKSRQRAQDGQVQSGGGSLSSALGATVVNRDFNICMEQTFGAHETLTAQVLQRKLNQSKNLSPQQRRAIEEDIQWLNAKAAGGRSPAPDPKNPQRYLFQLTDEEQMEITSANNQFANTVHEKCEAQYGGMSQFAGPGGRRAPIDTRVALPDLWRAAPAPAQQPSALQPSNNCMASVQGLRWKLMTERMERKLQTLPNLSPEERKAWEEDIAAVRAAEQNGATATPASPDPKNPMRYFTRLTPEDQMAMNQEYATRSQEIMTNCNGGSAKSNWSMATSKTAQMQTEARTNTQRAPAQAANAANAAQAWLDTHPISASNEIATGGSLSAGLGATQADYMERGGVVACFDRIKGFRAKQTADRLATKRSSIPAEQRQELEAWIAVWRAAEQAGLDQPTPPDPNDPQGYLRLLTNADQQELNVTYSAVHNKIMAECNSMDHMGVGAKNSKTKSEN